MTISLNVLFKENSERMKLIVGDTNIATSNNMTHGGFEVILSGILQVSENASLIVWLFVKIPQIIENYLNQSVSSLSLLFVVFWICGDTTSFVGYVVEGNLFQICIAAYHCILGLVLGLQYWYYAQVYPRKKGRLHGPQEENVDLPKHIARHESKLVGRTNRFQQRRQESCKGMSNLHTKRNGRLVDRVLKASLSSSALVQPSNALPVVSSGSVLEVQSTSSYKRLMEMASNIFIVISSSLKKTLSFEEGNTIAAWTCSMFYISSLPPQIIKNYRCKSTHGLSPYTFLLAIIGNSLYSISFIANLFQLLNNNFDVFYATMISNTPYIISSFVTICFDTVVFVQCLYYGDSNKSAISLNPNFPSNNFFTHYGEGNTKSTSDSDNRNLTIGIVNDQGNSVHDDETSFQTPAWYNNNHQIITAYDEQDVFGETYVTNNDPRRRRHQRNSGGLSRQNETTSLLNRYSSTTPPSHYISRSILDTQNQSSAQLPMLNSISNSTSKNNFINATKSTVSIASHNSVIFNGSGTGDNHQSNTSILNTSLIPSIVSNYSSISKKLSHESKTPFLPRDFLSDDFYQSTDYVSLSSGNISIS